MQGQGICADCISKNFPCKIIEIRIDFVTGCTDAVTLIVQLMGRSGCEHIGG